MDGVITATQAGVKVELEPLPGEITAMALHRDGELLLLIDPDHTPERLRDDLASILGHLLGNAAAVP